MNKRSVISRFTLLAAAVLIGVAPPSSAASYVWDGTTASYVLTSSDDFSFTTFITGAGGLDVTARDLKLDQNLTFGGAFSFTQTGGGGLYQGIDLATASTTITATAITLSGDIGKRNQDGNSLTLNTSAANGAINLNVSLGRSGAWYIPAGLTANAGTGTITVSGTNGQGWRSSPVSLMGGAINITGNVVADGAISLTNSGAGTISGIMSGLMSLTKADAGTLTMTGRSTYSGTTVVNGGTLQLNDARSLNGAMTVGSGATLTLQSNGIGGYYQPSSLTVNNATVNASIAAANRYHGIYTTSVSLSGTSTLSTPIFVSAAGTTGQTLTITVADGSNSTISGTVLNHPDATGGSLTKAGTGTLTMTGTQASGNSTTLTGNVLVSGGTLRVGGTVNSTSPTVTAIGNMTTPGRTVTVSSGATLSFISPDAIGQYNYASPVTLIADGGIITRIASANTFNSIGNVELKNGGTLRTTNGNGATVASFALNGTLTVSGTSGSFIDTLSGQTSNAYINLGTVGGSTTFNIGSTGDATADLTVSAVLGDKVLGGAAILIKAGAGKVVVSSANTYTGGTTLRAGTLVAKNNNAFGSSGTITLNDVSTSTSNTSILIDATSTGVTVGRAITVANQGSGTVTIGSATTSGSNQAIFSGGITLNKATTLTGGSGGDRTGFSGGIAGTADVTIAGTNRLLFSGTANTYIGTTTINSGATLQLSDGTSLAGSFLADSSDVTVTGSLKLAKGGNSETIGGLNGSGIVSAIAGSDTLIVGNGNANGTFSGALNNDGAALAFTKTGSGTQTLTGTSNYTGATTVSSGALALGTGGALGNTAVTISSGATFSTATGTTAGGAVAVASGGTLRGSGSVGAVTVANGAANLIAGTGTTGTLSLSSLTLDGTATLTIGVLTNYTSSAAFAVSGALAINGANVTLALPAGLLSNGTYQLLSYGTTTADENNFTISGPVIGARQFSGLSKDTVNKVFLYTIAGDSPIWTGANSTAFNGGNNWNLINAGTATNYIANDALLLNDTATGTTVDISGADVAPAVATFDNSTKDYILQGSHGLSSGSIVKSGTGNLTINNANAVTSVSVTAGTLTLGHASALGTAAVTLSGGTLDLNNQSTSASIVLDGGTIANTGTVNGVLSGAVALNKSSTGTLTLTTQNTFTGGTTISNGVVVLGHATNTLANVGAVTVSGGELSLGSNSDTVGAVTLTSGSITGTGTLTGTSYDLQAGVISAQLAGAGAATKSTAGTVTLSAANSNYSGSVIVAAGTIAIGDNAALGTGTVTLNGGSVALSGQTLANALAFGGGSISGSGTVSGAVSGSAAFTKSGSGALVLAGAQNPTGGLSVTGGTLEISGSLNSGTYAGTIASNGSGALALTGNSPQTLSGVISGSAALAKSGNGTLTLSGGSSTLTGNVSITGGKVVVTGFSATAQGSNPTLSALGNMTTVGRTISVGSGATLEIVASDAFGAYNYVNPVTFIADGGTIAAGLASVGVNGAFRSLGNITLRNGGALVSANGNASIALLVGSFAINGNVTVDGTSATGATISPEATQTFQNYINLGTNGSSSTTFTVAESNDAATADLTVSTVLANRVLGGAAGIVKAGEGRMVLAADNRYTGSTTISAGILAITSGGGIYRGGYNTPVITIASGATLELQNWNYNETTASLGGLRASASSMVVNGGTIRMTGTTSYGRGVTVNAGGATLEAATGADWTIDTVNDSAAWVYDSNPTVTLNGAGTGTFQKVLAQGTGALVKNGTGKWTLSGDNTYTGATTVTAGTLLINGSTSIASAVTVGINGTLGGTGIVGGDTTINGIHSPGNSPGIQTFFGNLSYVNGGTPNPTVNWELASNTTTVGANPTANFDQIIVWGNLDFTHTTNLNLSFNGVGSTVLWSDSLWDSNQSWLLYDVTGLGVTTNIANLNLTTINWLDSGSNLFSTAGGSFALSQNGEDVMLNFSAIPEPSTYGIALGAMALALAAVRRQRRKKS